MGEKAKNADDVFYIRIKTSPQTDADPVYHDPDCHMIRSNRSAYAETHDSRRELERQGRRPCTRSGPCAKRFMG
jgi:hypothetical protein